MHNNNLACIIRECNIQFWMSIVKQDWLVKSELDPNRLACPNPKEFFFLIYFFIFCFVRALTSAVVKWHKGQILLYQFQNFPHQLTHSLYKMHFCYSTCANVHKQYCCAFQFFIIISSHFWWSKNRVDDSCGVSRERSN